MPLTLRTVGKLNNLREALNFLTILEKFLSRKRIFSHRAFSERIQHAFGIEDLVNPYAEVTNLDNANLKFPDVQRLVILTDFLNATKQPFFAHVHFMVTHGPKYNPVKRVFSLGKKQDKRWMTDFYDDAILEYDGYVRRVVSTLKKNQQYENTLLILTSDHGSQWQATTRLPLIMRFPNQDYKGVRKNNTQRIDVAPTILDYLGGEVPTWMTGKSFLKNEPDALRPIIFAYPIAEEKIKVKGGWSKVPSPKPPFYSLRGVGVIIANRGLDYDLVNKKIKSGYIYGHTAPVDKKILPSTQEVFSLIISHLQESGYDTSSILAR